MITHQDILLRYANNATTREDVEVLIKALGLLAIEFGKTILDDAPPQYSTSILNLAIEEAQQP